MASNYVSAKYQEIYDLGTVAGQTTVIGIHAPTDGSVYKMLSGFFDQFRKYRYKGCSVKLVPAAQLPADPLQVSFEAGELTVDPRDLLNPILFHGCHGESLGEILDNIYNGDPSMFKSSPRELRVNNSLSDDAYYSALSDPSFRKYGIQSGASVTLKPMVHPLALTNPLVPSDSVAYYTIQTELGALTESANGHNTGMLGNEGVPNSPGLVNPGYLNNTKTIVGDSYDNNYPQMFTSGLRPLGWFPTWQFTPNVNNGTGSSEGLPVNISKVVPGATRLPKLFMGFFILPPSYTQEMYFRMIITHYFEFKDFSTSLTKIGTTRKIYTETLPEPTTPPASGTMSLRESNSVEVIDGTVVQSSEGCF